MGDKDLVVDWDLSRRRLDGPGQLYLVLVCLVIPVTHLLLHNLVFTVRLRASQCTLHMWCWMRVSDSAEPAVHLQQILQHRRGARHVFAAGC